MSISLFSSLRHQLASRRQLLLHSATWTVILTVTVAVASFSAEVAFVSAISTSSSFSRVCEEEGTVRVPLDVPGEILCLPSHLFTRSMIDSVVSVIFAALVVAGSTCVVRAMGSWEFDVDH